MFAEIAEAERMAIRRADAGIVGSAAIAVTADGVCEYENPPAEPEDFCVRFS